ncbi:saccharolysin [[Candida] jaroonii]|uniref:Saccharolysin n=1 Tax=[Candida] jaroonii TaxID=467808 RepID=A0ACA9YEH0_9ASCO|nr:saccharolysin [[Candida] jaroonii]
MDYQSIISTIEYPKWDHSIEDIKSIGEQLIKEETQFHDYVATIENPTMENLWEPYIDHIQKNHALENQIDFYKNVSTDKAIRDASSEISEKMENNSIEQGLRVDVYNKFKQFYESVDLNSLDHETKRHIEKTMLDYKRNGLDLPDTEREHFKQLQLKLSELRKKFDKNLGEQTEHLLFTKEELDGVPEDTTDTFEKVGDKLKMTYKYPDLFPVLRHAHNQDTRKQAYLGNQSKCKENADILKQMIRIRYDIAKALGYKTYSQYVLEERLAKNQENVLNFLNDLRDKFTPMAKDELTSLMKLKNEDLKSKGFPEQDVFYQWDNAYYSNILLENEYQVDHNKIKEYFPLDSTISKMLGFYETLFDLKFYKITDLKSDETWHDDVKKFAVFQDIQSGTPKFMGFIFFDLHPRDGKYGHAASFGLGPGYFDKNGKRSTPFNVLVCNFSKPTGDKPALLKHSEVQTFFHELGHGVHSILSETRYAKFHGTRVPRDFVEAPSQMLEFWIWSKNELKSLSKHYLTGEPINDELIDQLIKSKNVNNGLGVVRQLHFGLFDMKVHTIDNEDDLNMDLDEVWNNMRSEITLNSTGDSKTSGYASFGHIAHGYQSGYYGYLYSKVFATDMFYTLFKEDPMNVTNGLRYRDIILKRGNSKDMMDNLIELLGREPNTDNFMKDLLE